MFKARPQGGGISRNWTAPGVREQIGPGPVVRIFAKSGLMTVEELGFEMKDRIAVHVARRPGGER